MGVLTKRDIPWHTKDRKLSPSPKVHRAIAQRQIWWCLLSLSSPVAVWHRLCHLCLLFLWALAISTRVTQNLWSIDNNSYEKFEAPNPELSCISWCCHSFALAILSFAFGCSFSFSFGLGFGRRLLWIRLHLKGRVMISSGQNYSPFLKTFDGFTTSTSVILGVLSSSPNIHELIGIGKQKAILSFFLFNSHWPLTMWYGKLRLLAANHLKSILQLFVHLISWS